MEMSAVLRKVCFVLVLNYWNSKANSFLNQLVAIKQQNKPFL